METKAFFAEKGRLKISMQALPMGKDWCFIVTGGELPHLGAVSAGGCTFAFAGHKEHAVTHRMCEAFGKKLPMNVAVFCGIHLDNISREEIADTIALCDELAEKFIESYFAEEKP